MVLSLLSTSYSLDSWTLQHLTIRTFSNIAQERRAASRQLIPGKRRSLQHFHHGYSPPLNSQLLNIRSLNWSSASSHSLASLRTLGITTSRSYILYWPMHRRYLIRDAEFVSRLLDTSSMLWIYIQSLVLLVLWPLITLLVYYSF